MTDERFQELKREINHSRSTGSLTLKSNCQHCHETGIEYWVEGNPVLCRCMKIDPVKMTKQNRGELTVSIQ